MKAKLRQIRNIWAKNPSFFGLIIGVGTVVLLWVCCLVFALRGFYGGADSGRFGQLGDTFGIVNALFTGLAIIGAAITIWQQNQQIKEQKTTIANESAERYMTARLNANTCYIQSLQSYYDLLGKDANSYEVKIVREEIDILRREAKLLMMEARVAFEEITDPFKRYRKSIHVHCMSTLTTLCHRMVYDNIYIADLKDFIMFLEYHSKEISFLIGVCDNSGFDSLAAPLCSIRDLLSKILFQRKNFGDGLELKKLIIVTANSIRQFTSTGDPEAIQKLEKSIDIYTRWTHKAVV